MKPVSEFLRPGERRSLREFERQNVRRQDSPPPADVATLAAELQRELHRHDKKTVSWQVPLLVTLAMKHPSLRAEYLARALAALRSQPS